MYRKSRETNCYILQSILKRAFLPLSSFKTVVTSKRSKQRNLSTITIKKSRPEPSLNGKVDAAVLQHCASTRRIKELVLRDVEQRSISSIIEEVTKI